MFQHYPGDNSDVSTNFKTNVNEILSMFILQTRLPLNRAKIQSFHI